MEKIIYEFYRECTIEGYIRSNQHKMIKIWGLRLVTMIAYVTFYFLFAKHHMSNAYTLLGTIVFYAVIYIIYYVLKMRIILKTIPKVKIGNFPFDDNNIHEYFNNKKNNLIKTHFKKDSSDKSLKRIEYALARSKELEINSRKDVLFEKAVLAAINLPIWVSFVNIFLNEASSENFFNYLFLLSLVSFMISLFIIYLRDMFVPIYIDFRNASNKEYKLFYNALSEYYFDCI